MSTLSRILSGEPVRQVIEEVSTSRRKFRAKYIISSERASRRSDEDHVEFYSDRIMDVGDSFELDGLTWYVDEVVSDSDRSNIGTKAQESNDACPHLTVYDNYYHEWHVKATPMIEDATDDELAKTTNTDELEFDHPVVFSIQFHTGSNLGYDWECHVLAQSYDEARDYADYLCKEYDQDPKRCVVQYAYLPIEWWKNNLKDIHHTDMVDFICPQKNLTTEATFKGSGKRINYDDDLVIVYDKDGNIIYKGIEDYDDMKYEDWKFDKEIGAYRFKDYIKNCL